MLSSLFTFAFAGIETSRGFQGFHQLGNGMLASPAADLAAAAARRPGPASAADSARPGRPVALGRLALVVPLVHQLDFLPQYLEIKLRLSGGRGSSCRLRC